MNAEKPLFEKNIKSCYRNTLVKEGVVMSTSRECLAQGRFSEMQPTIGIQQVSILSNNVQ